MLKVCTAYYNNNTSPDFNSINWRCGIRPSVSFPPSQLPMSSPFPPPIALPPRGRSSRLRYYYCAGCSSRGIIGVWCNNSIFFIIVPLLQHKIYLPLCDPSPWRFLVLLAKFARHSTRLPTIMTPSAPRRAPSFPPARHNHSICITTLI